MRVAQRLNSRLLLKTVIVFIFMREKDVRFQLVMLLAGSLSLVACDSGDDDDSAARSDAAAPSDGDSPLPGAVKTYSKVVLASYEDSLEAAKELDAAIDALLEDPSEDALEAARDAWRAAREPYLQTETYRFYDGPIDDPEDGPEGMINAWPLDEAYIDYVEGDQTAGIINDPSQTIDAESLAELNEKGAEENIATGYHAIEFLLWGQDLDEDGPGDRPYTDFVEGGTAKNQDRRAEYLRVTSALLVDNLGGLVDAWAERGAGNYRAELERVKSSEALRRILTGMIVLSGFETGGERLQTAYDTADQEDEHSCFSDNTHRDMVQDVRGIQNVYLGRYTRRDGSKVSGTSVREAVAELDEKLADEVADRIATALALAEALEPPFDREISLDNDAGRERVLELIGAMRDLEKVLFEVFDAFGLMVEIPE